MPVTHRPDAQSHVDLSSVVTANIRAELARRGIRQVVVAEVLGISQSQVSKRFNGHIDWTLREVDQIAELLGIDPMALIPRAVA